MSAKKTTENKDVSQKPEVEKKILIATAKQGVSWSYDLWHERNIATRKAVDDALDRLSQKNLIRIATTKKRGSTKTIYELTVYGLFSALYCEKSWESIDVIAGFQEQKLPLIFGKWDYFIKKGAKEFVVNALHNFFFPVDMEIYYLPFPYPLLKEIVGLKIGYESSLCEELTREVLFPEPVPSPILDEAWGWAVVLLNDPDLKKYMIEEITNRENYYSGCLNQIRLWKEYIKELEKENKKTENTD